MPDRHHEPAGGIFGSQLIDTDGSPLSDPEEPPEPETETQKGEGWWFPAMMIVVSAALFVQVSCMAIAWKWCVVPAFQLRELTRFQIFGMVCLWRFCSISRDGGTSTTSRDMTLGNLKYMGAIGILLLVLWLLQV